MLTQAAGSAWTPRADVYRTATGWLIKLDLAGVASSDLEVVLDGRILRVMGVRRDRNVLVGLVPYAIEISYSRFERVFELPERAEQVSVSTEHDRGMVLIRLEEARDG